MLHINSYERQLIGRLLKPSLLSGCIAVIAGMIVTIGVIITFSFSTSSFQSELYSWQSSQQQKPLTQPGAVLPENDRPSLGSSWPLLIVWGIVGTCAYIVTMSVVRTIQSAKEFKDTLGYSNAHPSVLVKNAAEHVVVRLVALVVLGILLNIFIKRLIPYSILAAHASAVELPQASGFLYALLSFVVISLGLHTQVVFLRLVFGRLRVFNSQA